MDKISVIIIAKDEEPRIETTLKSASWADEIIVIDSESSDSTARIAKSFTDKVYIRRFDNFSSQKNFAVSMCRNDWVFSLDCDEVITQELRDSVTKVLNSKDSCSAYRVKRINRIFGKVLTHATGEDTTVRLFRKSKARFVQPIHEFLTVDGDIGELEGELLHNSTLDIRSEFDKTQQYTELEARWLLERNIRPVLYKLLLYPACVFFKIYLLKMGFLDGKEGFLYAAVSARYSFIKYAKARRMMRNKSYLESIIAKRFDKLSESFPDKIDEADSRLSSLLESLSITAGKLILDVGCGKGRFVDVVNRSGARCIGIDISEYLIREAMNKNSAEFVMSNAANIAFKNRHFDAVYAVEVIEHLPDLEGFVREAASILKSAGRLVIIDRNILSINNRRFFVPNIIIKKYHEVKNDWMYPRGFPYTERWFLRGRVANLLKRYFDSVKSSYIMSDSEEGCATTFLFKSVPASRHFILWQADYPRA